uniref:BTB domain-containing protein n=1 Tax=Oryza nivara TaxID=4536 RepID=A0A0E0J4D5_ORYNI
MGQPWPRRLPCSAHPPALRVLRRRRLGSRAAATTAPMARATATVRHHKYGTRQDRWFSKMAGSSPSTGGGGGEASTVPSTSTIVAEMATGSHVLTVDGYSGTKGLAVGEHVKSGTFVAGGHSWHIKYFPNGATDEASEWVSVFVCLTGKSSDAAKTKDAAVTVKARCKLTLLDGRDGRAALPPPPPLTKSSELRTFSSGKGGSDQWGHKKFVRRKELEDPSKRLLRHDRFSVRCDVTVAVGIRTDDVTAKLPAPPPSDLHRHLGRLLKTKAGAHVTFDVAGVTFAAHRCVLAARSPVFMTELLGPMKEKDAESHVVAIRDMDARAFKAMLHFIYTDSLPKVDDGGEAAAMAQHLLAAADRYDIERLKLICEDKLRGRVDATTAATTLALAEQHGCRRLKEACLRFMASSPANLKAAMASDGFEHLARSCPSLLKELAANLARSTCPDHPRPPPTLVTTSTIVVEVVSGSHVLKIDGFSRTIGASDGGSYVKSGRFVVGGHGWRVGYRANGDGDDDADAGWISIALHLDDPNVDGVRARFKISLLAAAHDGHPPPPPRSDQSTTCTFSTAFGVWLFYQYWRGKASPTWSFPRFITTKALEESVYLVGDSFSLRCDVAVVKDIRTEDDADATTAKKLVGVLVPPSDIGAHLGRLLAAGHGADVAVHVGGETFAAHRCVLAARSPVFMAELLGPMAMSRHNNEDTVHVHDMEPRVFEAMLHFIYNDSLPEVDDDEVAAMAQHLLVAADRYDMERLKLICEDTLCSHVDASTAATALTLAEQHHCERLKEACFKFMENPSNLKAVMASDDFLHLTRSCSSLLKKLAKLAA